MIFSKENKPSFQAVVKQTLSNLLIVVFFALQHGIFFPDISQNLNTFEDTTFQELPLDSDGREKDDGYVGLFYGLQLHSKNTYTTTRLNKLSRFSVLKNSYLTRAPPQV